MWCSTCQQDIPALGSPGSGGELRCGKCGEMLAASEQPVAATRDNKDVAMSNLATSDKNAAFERLLRCPPLPEADWTLEAELRGVQRLLSSLKSRPVAGESMLLHLPEMPLPGWHASGLEASATATDLEPPPSTSGQPRTSTAAWTILSLSLAVFACGAVLLAWSLLGQREDLWSIGLPLALIGQAGMILGLVLQIDGISGRRAADIHPPTPRRPNRTMPVSVDERLP